jgi:hypothetical protein
MPIEVQLSISQTDLLAQQSPPCAITVTNKGPGDAILQTPLTHKGVLGMKVTDVKTGVDVLRWREDPMPPLERTVKAGDSLKDMFLLQPVAHIHALGEFDVAALIKNNGKIIESNTVRVKIAPVTPKAQSLVSVNGAHSPIKYGVSVNRVADPPALVRHKFEIMNDGGAMNAWPLAPVPPATVARISACANRSVTHAHWIAWIEGDALRCQHMGAGGAATAPQALTLPAPGATIVAPLSIDPAGRDPAPMPGRALLWFPGLQGGTLRVYNLAADAKPQPGESRNLDGEPPVWLQSHERTDKSRWLVRAAKIDGKQTVQLLPWPEGGKVGATPKTIGSFDGDLIAGDAVLDDDNTLHVGMLVLTDPKHSRQVKLLSWACPTDDPAKAGPVRDIAWAPDQPVVQAIVRIDPKNEPVALLAGAGGWQSYRKIDGLKPAPAQLNTATAVDLLFFKEVPAFLVGRPVVGYDVIQLDGSPLPDSCG